MEKKTKHNNNEKQQKQQSGAGFPYVLQLLILKCLWNEKLFVLIWKAFQNAEE